MTVSNINQTAATNNTGSSKGATGTGSSALTPDAFLKVLSAQLANQDPMAAGSDSSDSMQQMTQLGILNSLQSIAASQTESNSDAQIGRAMTLIGHQVSYVGDDGKSVSGKVEKVDVTGGNVTLTVDGKTGILPSHISQVST